MPAKSESGPGWRAIFRFSLRQLMLATALVAVGCYALRWASPWWATVLFYTSLFLVVAGALIAVNRRGETRSFWAGFSICGIAHLLLLFYSGLDRFPTYFLVKPGTTLLTRWTYQRLQPALTVDATVVSLEELQKKAAIEMRGRTGSSRQGNGLTVVLSGEDGYFYASGPGPYYVHELDFVEVGQGVWTLLLSYLGGCISLAIYRTRPTE